MRRIPEYESDPKFDGAFQVKGYRGIAFRVLGWELEPVSVITCECGLMQIERPHGGGRTVDKGDPNCDHKHASCSDEPEYERTGKVVAIMIGDDHKHIFDKSDLTPLAREAYCGECGQVGCCHDGLDRSELISQAALATEYFSEDELEQHAKRRR